MTRTIAELPTVAVLFSEFSPALVKNHILSIAFAIAGAHFIAKCVKILYPLPSFFR